jgi:hypothetical protein
MKIESLNEEPKADRAGRRWTPERCELCGETFTEKWVGDCSLSGEQVWQCSVCGCWHYPRIRNGQTGKLREDERICKG